MQLDDYFDILAPDDIRLKGTRVGIETILSDYLQRKRSPDEIAQAYPSITLEQVFATILYCLHNTEQVDAYLADWQEHGRRMREEQERNPPAWLVRVRALRAETDRAKAA